MNETAKGLNLTQTHFENPHGLPAEGHQTTALELAQITRRAYAYESFRTIVSTVRKKIPWQGRDYDRVLTNKNKMLRLYEGANGVKTGYTKKAGRCLVSGARRNGMQLICVVLAARTCGTNPWRCWTRHLNNTRWWMCWTAFCPPAAFP
jgi:D-alanyl-D-alanine carboxypeptidase